MSMNLLRPLRADMAVPCTIYFVEFDELRPMAMSCKSVLRVTATCTWQDTISLMQH